MFPFPSVSRDAAILTCLRPTCPYEAISSVLDVLVHVEVPWPHSISECMEMRACNCDSAHGAGTTIVIH